MKYFKSIALAVAVCMMLSVMPAAVFADTADTYTSTETENNGSGDVSDTESTETPEPVETEEPEATPTEDPDVTPDPSVTDEPDTTQEPDVTETPDTTATPTSTPGNKYSITVDPVPYSTIAPSPTAAAAGATVTITGNTSRGYKYTEAYYQDAEENQTKILGNTINVISRKITMPESDIVIYATVDEMTDQELYDDAYDQYSEANTDIKGYNSVYINNSSNYDSSDIREMKALLSDAEKAMDDLNDTKQVLKTEISNDNVSLTTRKDVIYAQENLDEIMAQLEELSDSMGGEDVEYFDMDITVNKGGKLIISGLVSQTVNGLNSKATETIEDIYNDGSSSLTFKIQTQNGYSVSGLKINGNSMSISGNTITIKAGSIPNYISGGVMKVVASFSYSNVGSGGSYAPTYSGSNSNSNNNNSLVINNNGTTNAIFSDLGDVSWAEQSIMALYNMGIVNGMGDGTFAPQASVTREQFAKMIVGVMGYTVNTNATTSFSDDQGDWYTPYIAAAVENGIITGRDDGSFGVGDNITRQDIAVIIHRTQGSPAVEVHEFPDSAMISDYAVQSVSYLYSTGIASGDDNGNFNPVNSATRAEASKMLYGLYSTIN